MIVLGPNDVGVDVGTDQQHPLRKHKVRIGTSPPGGAVLVLTFTAVDLWTAILTGMAAVRQSGYAPIAVQAGAPQDDPVRNGWASMVLAPADAKSPPGRCSGPHSKPLALSEQQIEAD